MVWGIPDMDAQKYTVSTGAPLMYSRIQVAIFSGVPYAK
jgi:hypothetical protein